MDGQSICGLCICCPSPGVPVRDKGYTASLDAGDNLKLGHWQHPMAAGTCCNGARNSG